MFTAVLLSDSCPLRSQKIWTSCLIAHCLEIIIKFKALIRQLKKYDFLL